MSAIAGIVRLKGAGEVCEGDLRTVLARAAISEDCPLQTLVLPEKGIAVGKVGYGADAGQSAGLGGDAGPLAVLMLGEVYAEEADGFPSHAAYILQRYRTRGAPEFIRDLNGAFSLVVVDRERGTVVLATDHLNSIMVHAVERDGFLYFATDIKALMALDRLPCRVNLAMALMLLTTGEWLNRETLFEGVTTLDSSAVWRIEGGKIARETLWQYAIEDAPPDRGLDYYVGQTERLLRQAVRRQTRFGAPAIFMSGGLDTRTIVSFLDDPSRIQAVTFTGVGEDVRHPYGDTALARQLAELVGVRHTVLRYDAGRFLQTIQNSVYESDGAACFLLEDVWDRVHEACGSDYVLTGDECISVAAGPVTEDHILECLGIRPLREVPSLWPYLRQDRIEEFKQFTDDVCRRRLEGLSGRPTNNQLDELSHRQRLFHFVNPKRRMHALHGLLARRPLLDLDFMNFLRTVPWKYRNGKTIVRQALRRVNPEAYRLPRARTRELVDYGLHFAALEKAGGQVSAFFFDDNPLLPEMFDVARLRELVARVAAYEPSAAPKRRFSMDHFMPPHVRQWLAAFARKYLKMHARHLTSPTAILLQVAKVAAALRHVANRCRKPTRDWSAP